MKRITLIFLLIFIIGLFACDVKDKRTLECLSDEIASSPSSYMVMALPENVFLTESAADGRIGLFSHQDYEILQEIFTAADTDAAIRHISGQDLQPILLPDGSARFSWVSAGENGMLSCSAVLLSDGAYYYSLCIRCPSELAKIHREEFDDILSSAALRKV